MKLIAKCTIFNGVKTYNAGDVFETDVDFTESLVPSSADYLEPMAEGAEGAEVNVEVPENLEELTVKELKALCKKLSILDVNGKNKEELIEAIELAIFDEQEGE